MTYVDNLCDICEINKPEGVFSTSVPFSCAMCMTCINHGADPEWIFKYWLEEIGAPENFHSEGRVQTTFKDGKYITYKDWYDANKPTGG